MIESTPVIKSLILCCINVAYYKHHSNLTIPCMYVLKNIQIFGSGQYLNTIRLSFSYYTTKFCFLHYPQ